MMNKITKKLKSMDVLDVIDIWSVCFGICVLIYILI